MGFLVNHGLRRHLPYVVAGFEVVVAGEARDGEERDVAQAHGCRLGRTSVKCCWRVSDEFRDGARLLGLAPKSTTSW